MEKVLLTVVAASGLCAVSSRGERRYHFVYEPMNMSEALSRCRQEHTELATVGNLGDVAILNNMVNLSQMVGISLSHRAWIGLYDDVSSWRWSLSDAGFYRHGETDFRRWSAQEPNNLGSDELCTELGDNGLWNDLSCKVSLKAVCMDATGTNVTFVLTNETLTWPEAQSHCRAHHTDLASVRNMEENQKIKDLLPAGQPAWIGLFRDSWKWTDGSNSSFRFWAEQEPDNRYKTEDCVVADLNNSGRWEDWTCDWKRAFVCSSEVAPASQQVVKLGLLKKSSTLDLSDPAVAEHIVQQLRQRLEERGLQGDLRLSWRRQPGGKIFHQDETQAEQEKLEADGGCM